MSVISHIMEKENEEQTLDERDSNLRKQCADNRAPLQLKNHPVVEGDRDTAMPEFVEVRCNVPEN